MTIYRRQLYEAGLPFGEAATRQKIGGGMLCGGGGSDDAPDNNSTSAPVTTNTDKRLAVQGGVGVTGDNNTISYNDSDTVKALADAGADIIKSSGGAVIELARFQGANNTESFNTLVTQGGRLIDKLLDKASESYGLANRVVDSFTPTDSKNADNTKYLYIAAAVVAGAVLLQKGK